MGGRKTTNEKEIDYRPTTNLWLVVNFPSPGPQAQVGPKAHGKLEDDFNVVFGCLPRIVHTFLSLGLKARPDSERKGQSESRQPLPFGQQPSVSDERFILFFPFIIAVAWLMADRREVWLVLASGPRPGPTSVSSRETDTNHQRHRGR